MADRIAIKDASDATVYVATDEVTRNAQSEQQQVVKIALGADGAHDTLVDSGQQTSANSLPVVIANDQSSIPVAATLAAETTKVIGVARVDGTGQTADVKVTLDGETVAVASLPAIPAGSNNIGDVDVLTLPSLPAGANNIGDVDVLTLPSLPAGSNNIGDVDVLTVPADPFGANADAASTSGSISAKLRQIATNGHPVTQSTAANLKALVTVSDGTNNITIETSEADGESNTANRLKIDAANAIYNGSTWDRMRGDIAGIWAKLFPGRSALKNGATSAITDTTSTQVIAGVASNYVYVTSVSVWNASAVDTYLKLQDGSGGTTLYVLPCPKGSGAVISFSTPLLVPTVGNGLYAAVNAAANPTIVSATGYVATV